MKLVVTGGGTGGHVFPALEVARVAKAEGADLLYLGSNRGQEGSACHKAGITFRGYGSQPLYSLKTLRGWKGLSALLRARQQAKRALKRLDPDAVFSTGGYAAGPVVSAAQALGIPTVLHEQNSVPGRSNLMFAKRADMVCLTFHSSEAYFEDCRTVRTGMPVRQTLRDVAEGPREKDLMPLILIVGGSQGAQPVNEAVLAVATRLVGRPINWLHVTGKQHFEAVFLTFEKLGLKYCYDVKAYLEADDMAAAYGRSTLVVGRSGAGMLSELATFRLPSVVVPYPFAFANHQALNAAEFEELGAATVIDQEGLTPGQMESAILEWIEDPSRCEAAAKSLAEWDSPNAADQIMEFVRAAGAS
ncbi:MAG: undecaprenyldiphospho-muramoylpentapeptide beta-N-acetylglucosaminyltransferase [Fimbriimonadaceae bacterium]|nr:undecaprenyldiphospho-muramoylpentapeptide beta-N-acetylglucosaminyltransferase [Fimbriimonadaceae bacterium]